MNHNTNISCLSLRQRFDLLISCDVRKLYCYQFLLSFLVIFGVFSHEILEYIITSLENDPGDGSLILAEVLTYVFVLGQLLLLGLLKIHQNRINYRMMAKMQIFLSDAFTAHILETQKNIEEHNPIVIFTIDIKNACTYYLAKVKLTGILF